jgi:AcrR family transcriptional regulator
MTAEARTRTIARDAVRAALSQTAFELARERGFDNVTVDEMAAAAGVSRSTLLRYFGTKEEAVLSAFEDHGLRFAEAVRARPADEDHWTALRRSLEGVVPFYLQDPRAALGITRFIMGTPALLSRQAERQLGWRPVLTAALAEREGAGPDGMGGDIPFRLVVLVSAALGCMDIAVGEWAANDGARDLDTLLAEAFDALTGLPVS